MFRDDAAAARSGILDRHFVSGERHHARTLCAMPAIQRQFFGFGSRFAQVAIFPCSMRRRKRSKRRVTPPLSGIPESLARRLAYGGDGLTPSVAPARAGRFPECLPIRGPLYLRDSGAVAPSVPPAGRTGSPTHRPGIVRSPATSKAIHDSASGVNPSNARYVRLSHRR